MMIDIWDIKDELDKYEIKYSQGNDFITFLMPIQDFEVKYFFDINGDQLELSAYAFEMSRSDWVLRVLNSYNLSGNKNYKMLSFKRLIPENNNKLCVEFNIPLKYVDDADIVINFLAKSAAAIEEIDALLTKIEEAMPFEEKVRCYNDSLIGLEIDHNQQIKGNW